MLCFCFLFLFKKSNAAKETGIIQYLDKSNSGKCEENDLSPVNRWHSGEGRVQLAIGNKQQLKAFPQPAAYSFPGSGSV